MFKIHKKYNNKEANIQIKTKAKDLNRKKTSSIKTKYYNVIHNIQS